MENETLTSGDAPLTEKEVAMWELLVSEGSKIRAPIVARQEAKRLENRAKFQAERKGVIVNRKERHGRDSLEVIPVETKRWIILRFSGVSFHRSFEMSGTSWADIQKCKAKSEEYRCAFAAMEENSRQLMRAKAMSVVESSQDEGARVSLAQIQTSLKILETLDCEHFGERRLERRDDTDSASGGGGGFVINVIGDAAARCAKPEGETKKALVYTDV